MTNVLRRARRPLVAALLAMTLLLGSHSCWDDWDRMRPGKGSHG